MTDKPSWALEYEEHYVRTTNETGVLSQGKEPGTWVLDTEAKQTGPYKKSDLTYMLAVLTTRPTHPARK